MPPEVERQWVEFFAADGRQTVTSDPDAYARIRRNTTISVAVSAAVGAVLVVLALWVGRTSSIILGSALVVAGAVFVVLTLRKAPALLRQQAGAPAATYAVGNDGITLPVAHLEWSSIRGVFSIDESHAVAWSRRRRGIPGIAARWAGHNGRAAKHLVLVVEDGRALRDRLDRRWRRIVETWPGGTEPAFGTIWLDLDTMLAPDDVGRLIAAVTVQAEARGIQTSWSDGSADYVEYMGRLSGVFDDTERPPVPQRRDGNPFIGDRGR